MIVTTIITTIIIPNIYEYLLGAKYCDLFLKEFISNSHNNPLKKIIILIFQ